MKESFLSNNEILAGTYIPHPVSDKLSLVALVQGATRSTILKMLIVQYLEDKSVDKLINELSKNAFEIWLRRKLKKPSPTLNVYFDKELIPSLKRRRVSDEHITVITKKIGELNAAHEKRKAK
jgi:hypothetical protein